MNTQSQNRRGGHNPDVYYPELDPDDVRQPDYVVANNIALEPLRKTVAELGSQMVNALHFISSLQDKMRYLEDTNKALTERLARLEEKTNTT